MTNLFKPLFFITLISGTLITISSNSWLGMWMGLEINMLSFIALISHISNLKTSEASMKYFLTQALTSMILLTSVLMNSPTENIHNNLTDNLGQSMIINSCLLTKMGAAPFHFWFPEVMEGLSWINALVLATWQKIAPMTMISYTMNLNEKLLVISVMACMIISSIVGLNQTSIRKIMAYSSINHLGWMLLALMTNEMIWLWYLIIYSTINTFLMAGFWFWNTNQMNQMFFTMQSNPIKKTFFMLNLLSLGGIPPMIGFMPKWFTIQSLISNKLFSLTWIMIVTTLITMFFYMRLITSPITLSSNSNMLEKQVNDFKPKNISIINSLISLSLIFCTLAMNWI
uniref:NADH dehydrogenase subunit 2 n=1 Tax=Meliboeus sinae TaxID=2946727 RepID=UPI00207938F8|nr:NADH dehydrogenase subunit 2 [Meliboeus sinae]URN73089.1 NADH dehydrogenase subunit 2 [Meliboeus sinae]